MQDAKNGNISNSYEYEPFGAVVSGTEPNDVLFTSNGEEYQEATGLQYLRARHLNTAIGRFMSEDPYEGSTGNIMTQNRYAYAENDPVNKRDLGGHMALLKKIKRSARRVAKKVVKTVKTVASRIKSSVRGAPKKIASAVKSASIYSRASAKATLGYVRTKYKSAEQRAKDIRKTLKAQYDSLRKKVSCGIKKSVTGGISKKEHYARNQYNTDLPQTEKQMVQLVKNGEWVRAKESDAACHQNNVKGKYKNVKYISSDGHKEVVYSREKKHMGEIVTNDEDMGTYNFASYINDPRGHVRKDLIPWLIWGNTPDDKTTFFGRSFTSFKGRIEGTVNENGGHGEINEKN